MKRGRNNRRRQGGGNNPNRALDSNGPDVRIRGTANQIYDKYQTLARDAASAGDRVRAENYLQHAEHYHRLIKSQQPPQQQQAQPSEAVDADGEQPSIEEDKPKQKRRSNGADEAGAEEKAAKDASEETSAEEKVEASEEKPKPRRRTRRPKKDETAEAEADAKEEAAAS